MQDPETTPRSLGAIRNQLKNTSIVEIDVGCIVRNPPSEPGESTVLKLAPLLANHPNLASISLYSNYIDDLTLMRFLSYFKGRKRPLCLDLEGNPITDESTPIILDCLSFLERLDLSATDVGNEFCKSLCEYFKTSERNAVEVPCTQLILSDCEAIKDDGLRFILEGLKYQEMQQVVLSGIGISQVGWNHLLEFLTVNPPCISLTFEQNGSDGTFEMQAEKIINSIELYNHTIQSFSLELLNPGVRATLLSTLERNRNSFLLRCKIQLILCLLKT